MPEMPGACGTLSMTPGPLPRQERQSGSLLPPVSAEPEGRAQIVCLCGPVKFTEEYRQAIIAETLAGRIVVYTPDVRAELEAMPPQEREAAIAKLRADHLRKIDLADRVLVLNAGGYVGESTLLEIEHAASLGKPVSYLWNGIRCPECGEPAARDDERCDGCRAWDG